MIDVRSKSKFGMWVVLATPPLALLIGVGVTALLAYLESHGFYLLDSLVGAVAILLLTGIVALLTTAATGKWLGMTLRSIRPVLAYVATTTPIFVFLGFMLYVGVLCGPCQD